MRQTLPQQTHSPHHPTTLLYPIPNIHSSTPPPLSSILNNYYYKLILMATKQPATTTVPKEAKVKKEATKK